MEKFLFSIAVCVFITCVMTLIILGIIVGYRTYNDTSATGNLKNH